MTVTANGTLGEAHGNSHAQPLSDCRLFDMNRDLKSVLPPEEAPLLPTPPFIPISLTPTLIGYLLILISAITYPIVSLLTRYSETEYSYHITAALIIRSVIISTLTIAFLSFIPSSALRVSRIQIILIVGSSVCAAVHYLLMYTALFYSPLGAFITIQSSSMPFAVLLCAIFLHEFMKMSEVIALIVSTVGVVLITHPSKDDFKSILGVGLSIGSALTLAVLYVQLRAMGKAHPMLTILGASLVLGLQSICFSTSTDWSAILENRTGTLFVVIASLWAFVTMVAFVTGIKRCRAGPALLIDTLSIPLSFAYGWLFLGESPRWFEVLGAGLVICGAGIIALQAVHDDAQP